MRREIRQYGDPVLRAKGKIVGQVDETLRALAADMIETMHDANGVGLAAQQVGEALQLTVIDVRPAEDRPSSLKINGRDMILEEAMPMALLNPQLTLGREIISGTEGCLSFPEISAEIDRSEAVHVRAMTLEGETIDISATGLLARALQHEIDHLNGILFIDRMNSSVKASLAGKLKRMQKETQAHRLRTRHAPGDQRAL
jgi:peptide deformylase